MISLVKKLKKRKQTISFAESCTGGKLSSTLTSISGASKIFSLGLVTYSNNSKIRILKVKKDIIKKYGAVSPECCKAMVINLHKISKANICVSVTGIAGPKGGSKLKPVGLVYIGLKKGNKIIIKKKHFKLKDRQRIQQATVKEVFKNVSDLLN